MGSTLAHDLFVGGGSMLLKIFLILLPIVTGLELLRMYGALARLRQPLQPLLRFLGLRPASADPFVAGVLFGFVYGSGLIFTRIREEGLPRRQVSLLAGILCMGHALPEDTLLFVGLGSNGALVLAIRIVLVIAITACIRLWPERGAAGVRASAQGAGPG